MRIASVLLVFLFLAGCGSSYFKVPKEEYQVRVRTLGVLPVLLDEASIVHPEKQQIVDLLNAENAGKEAILIQDLRDQKAYFDVRPVSGYPQDLFYQLVRGSSLGGEGKAVYRRYAFYPEAAAQLAEGHVVDGLLVVILNGLQRPETRWDRTRLKYLEANYNAIEVSAAVVTPTGEIVWEYPSPPGSEFLELQYPDFDEAYYNKTDSVVIRNITVDGLRRTLQERVGGLLGRGDESLVYRRVFSALASELQAGTFKLPGTGAPAPSAPPVAPAPVQQ